jgi:light-regulated signal transduction histidine kinase (bacteriophytochrome)
VVTLTAQRRDGYVVVSVADNGLGIDLSRHGTRLFGLYKRFHAHTEGKGLGLHLVKTQAEALGGKVEVESTPGRRQHLPGVPARSHARAEKRRVILICIRIYATPLLNASDWNHRACGYT